MELKLLSAGMIFAAVAGQLQAMSRPEEPQVPVVIAAVDGVDQAAAADSSAWRIRPQGN